jgi:hypothetical protein
VLENEDVRVHLNAAASLRRGYLYKGPEDLESLYASFEADLLPVHTNYR